MGLSKEQLLGGTRPTEAILVPEFPEPLRVAQPSGLLALRLRELSKAGKGTDSVEAMAEIVSDVVVSEAGDPLFSLAEAERFLRRLSPKSMTALISKFGAAMSEGSAPGNSEPSPSA